MLHSTRAPSVEPAGIGDLASSPCAWRQRSLNPHLLAGRPLSPVSLDVQLQLSDQAFGHSLEDIAESFQGPMISSAEVRAGIFAPPLRKSENR